MPKQRSKVRYSPEATRDLDEIWLYIAEELLNPDSAQTTVNDIMSSIEKLGDFPQMGPMLSSITNIDSAYRFLLCGSYIAFYHSDESTVNIDRVLYGKRDYIRILFEKE